MENRSLLPIGKIAALTHTTIPALRLYDEIGLLKPARVDPDSGYRYYDLGQCARLDMISYMKELGMSLEEIKKVFDSEDIVVIEEILGRKNEQFHQQMRDLQARHDAVERAIASIERYRKSPRTGTISLEYIDRRRIWGIPCSRNFYETGSDDYEKALNELRNTLIDKNITQVHTYNTGTSIKKSDFLQGHLLADDVFIFTDEHFDLAEETKLIDSGMFACIYLDSYNSEIEGAQLLRQFCLNNDYHIAGDYLCEVMTEFNVFSEAQRNMYIRLQVPVTFDR